MGWVFLNLFSFTKREKAFTVKPVLSEPHTKRTLHPVLSGHLPQSQEFIPIFIVKWTCIQRTTLWSGRGHPNEADLSPKTCITRTLQEIIGRLCSFKNVFSRSYLIYNLIGPYGKVCDNTCWSTNYNTYWSARPLFLPLTIFVVDFF